MYSMQYFTAKAVHVSFQATIAMAMQLLPRRAQQIFRFCLIFLWATLGRSRSAGRLLFCLPPINTRPPRSSPYTMKSYLGLLRALSDTFGGSFCNALQEDRCGLQRSLRTREVQPVATVNSCSCVALRDMMLQRVATSCMGTSDDACFACADLEGPTVAKPP